MARLKDIGEQEQQFPQLPLQEYHPPLRFLTPTQGGDAGVVVELGHCRAHHVEEEGGKGVLWPRAVTGAAQQAAAGPAFQSLKLHSKRSATQ